MEAEYGYECYARPVVMTRTSPHHLITARDIEILTALDRSPLTVQQLMKISRTFQQPFYSERRVQERLRVLCSTGRVRRWWYATAGRGGAPSYYQLTLLGYRILYGEKAKPPTRRYFAEVGIAHQHHTRCLADFIVHAVVAADEAGVELMSFARENTLRLHIGTESLFPDATFELVTGDDRAFRFHVELDNGTERIRSQKDIDSWERKIRLYDACQDRCDGRFRVLVVTTRSHDRLHHILDAANALVRNPQRSLFYGIDLTSFVSESDPPVYGKRLSCDPRPVGGGLSRLHHRAASR